MGMVHVALAAAAPGGLAVRIAPLFNAVLYVLITVAYIRMAMGAFGKRQEQVLLHIVLTFMIMGAAVLILHWMLSPLIHGVF